MCSKIIFVIATLYVVNASVITLNAYDDGGLIDGSLVDSGDSPSLRKCNNQECDQRCRRLKFPGGICVNGRCKCDNFRTAEVSVVNIAELSSDPTDLSEKRRCIPRICDIVCRLKRLGNGTCVEGRCKCSKTVERSFTADDAVDNEDKESELSLDDEVEDTEVESAQLSSDPTDLSEKRRCNSRICNRLCRIKRYENGTCVEGRCKCSNKVERSFTADDAVDNEDKESELSSDDEVEDTEVESAQLSSDPTDLSEKRRCISRICNRLCRIKRYENGTCVEGRCKCSNKVERSFTADDTVDNEDKESELSLDDEVEDTEVESAQLSSDPTDLSEKRRCNSRICNRLCRIKRYENGTCVEGRCKCSNKVERSFIADDTVDNEEIEQSELNLDDEVEDTEVEIAWLSSDPTDLSEKRRCISRICNRLCRIKRYENGTCVEGRCKCSNKVERSFTADDAVDNEDKESELSSDDEVEDTEVESAQLSSDPTDLSEKRRCNSRICNRLCRIKRYENGTCVEGRCKCSKKVERSFTADDAVDNEDKESELSLDDEVEDTEVESAQLSSDPTDLSEKRRCNSRICNRLCRIKRYENGTCVEGRCKCFNKVERSYTADDTVDNEDKESELSLDDEVEDTEVEVAQLSSDPTDLSEKRRCLPRICNIVCRLKHLGNGTCVEGRCKCSKKVERSFTADDTVDNVVEESALNLDEVEETARDIAGPKLDSADSPNEERIRICSSSICNRVCRVLQLRGKCVKKRCKCFPKATSMLEAAGFMVGDEVENSNLITDE